MIQQSASATEEMSSTSEELSGQAEQLRETAAFFKIEGGGRSGNVQQLQPRQALHAVTGAPKRKRLEATVHAKSAPEQKAKGVALEMSDADDSGFERY